MGRKLIIILTILVLITISVFGQTGTYTTNGYFYLPSYGESGTTAYNEYNTYMQIADTQIEANKTNSFVTIDTEAELENAITDTINIYTNNDFSIEDYLLVANRYTDAEAVTAIKAASTTSAELAGMTSDETGSGALVFGTAPTIYSKVTTKTTTATLTVAEAGLIVVTATNDYSITLPTAVGNSGLIYIIKKTDDNSNRITIDGNGVEMIDDALTYVNLNYQYSYVTLISDGSNWLIIGESTVKGGTF